MISLLFFRNPRLLILTVVLICVAGGMAIYELPRMEDPQLTPRAANLTTLLPGADAEHVAALVTEKIEEELRQIEEIKQVTSTSRPGVSFIAIELLDELSATDASHVWSRVRDLAEDARRKMPKEASQPEFGKIDIKAYALIVGLRWSGDGEPGYGILRRLAKDLRGRVESLRGTEKVDVFGAPNEEILVTISPEVATAMQLNALSISGAINASDSKVPAGQMRSGTDQLVLEVSGELNSLTQLERVPIQYGEQGQFVTLSDIAKIERTIQQPPDSKALLGDQAAVVIGVQLRSGTQLDRWARSSRDTLDQFRSGLPDGIEMETVFEQYPFVQERMQLLLMNLAQGAVAVFAVVWFMMGWRAASIVSLSLPLGVMFALGIMRFAGVPVHQMSIAGLIISLGLIVDNAIVMVDEIQLRIGAGEDRFTAVSQATRLLAVPLLGSTITTVLSFSPIALMPGPSGEFVGAIAQVTIFAIVGSLVIALTVIAAVTGIFMPLRRTEERRVVTWIAHGPLGGVARYLLKTCYRFPVAGVGLSVLLPILGFLGAARLEEQFFPPADRSQFQLELELPGTGAILETEVVARRVRSALLGNPEIERVTWFLGESAPAFYYNLVADRTNAANYAQAIVDCRANTDMGELVRKVQQQLGDAFPEVTLLARQLEQGPPFSAPIEIRLFGSDPARLRSLGDDLRLALMETPDVLLTRSENAGVVPKISLAVDEHQARLAGLDHQRIALEMNSLLEGSTGGSILEGTEELPIRVRVSSKARGDLNQIVSFYLASDAPSTTTNEGGHYPGVPLGAIANLELKYETGMISRLNGRMMSEIQAYITADVLPAVVLNRFRDRLKELNFELPDGYEIQFAGAEGERDEAIESLAVSGVGTGVLMVATLVIAMGSFRWTVLLFGIAGLSAGIGLGGLWATGLHFGFMSIVATMAMIGVAVNDSIVVLINLRQLPPDSRRDVNQVLACILRNARHVLTTSLTTVVGLLPLYLTGGEFWPPVAVCIASGVAGATLLALILVPCAFLLMGSRVTTNNSRVLAVEVGRE